MTSIPSPLNGKDVLLRPLEPEDLALLYELENSPELWDVSSANIPYSRYALKRYIAEVKNDLAADGQLRLVIERKGDGKPIGTADLTDYVARHGRAEVGIAIEKNARGAGHATEALQLLAAYAFTYLGIKRLFAGIRPSSKASVRLFERCGFVRAGYITGWVWQAGRYEDVWIYSLEPGVKAAPEICHHMP